VAVTLLPKSLPRWRSFLLGLGILLFGTQLFALDPSRTLFQYNFQSWTRQNGLPFNRIRAITQTADGYLWMATQNGLVRFDGTDFTRSRIPTRSGWHSQGIETLTLSPRGGLWFGLEGGAFGYFDGTNKFQALTESWLPPRLNVHSVQEQSDHSLWLAGSAGLVGLPGGKTNDLFTSDRLPEVWVSYEDSQHRVWLGTTEKGLFYIEGGKLKEFPDRDLVGNNIRAIAVDHQGNVWVGTTMGLRLYDRNFKRNDTLTDFTEVQALLADTHGAVWVGTTGGGLIRHLNGETSNLRKTNGLTEDYVSALFEDREGSLWVGTRNGLTQISDLKFPSASTREGLLSESVHGVCASSNGGIWCATSFGIYNYHDRIVTDIPSPATNSGFYVKRVLEARDGDLYAITGRREIQIYSNEQLVASHSNGNWPVGIAEDPQGVVVSISGQIFRVNRQGLTPFPIPGPHLEFGWIRNLSTCADGSLLVSSVNGAYRIFPDHVESWSDANGLLEPDVHCMFEDSDGTIWVGQANGMSRIKNHKATAIHSPLSESMIYTFVPDDFGNLWINSTAGILRVNRESLNAFADGNVAKPEFTRYDGIESVRTIDLTEIEAVSCKTTDGKIWLPSPLGAVEIDPAHILRNPIAPPVYIQKVLVNGMLQTGSSNAPVRAGNGELVFQYGAVTYIAPQKIHFRYHLEGYDDDWVDGGSQRSALYANLEPGNYVFHVQACNVDGVWNNAGASFAVTLPPAFYQTTWFKISAGAAILLGLSGIYGWRTRHLRQKEKRLQAANELLEKKISDRTKELAGQHNLLRTLIDNLPDAVFVKDAEGRVIIDNLAHARYLGFESTADSMGKSDFDVFPTAKAEEFRGPEMALLQSGKEFNAEEHLKLKSGDTVWFRTTKVPLRDERGQIVGLAGINRDITERKKWEAEMQLLHKQLLETSRHAGMAEVATSVLHNVGNVLNSVNVSASVVGEQVRSTNLDRLSKAILLLQENRSDLARFLTQDEKGTKLVSFLDALFVILKKERETVQREVEGLTKNVEHIKKIVAMQQSYAKVAGVIEIINPTELMEDSLRMHEAAFLRHAVKIVRDFSAVPKIAVDRHKVIQILVNLLSNAKYACDGNAPNNRVIRVCLSPAGDDRIRMEVIDNGKGIAAENLTRVFSYGFTTRKNGHGFGLHSGALAAKEMGGSLHAASEGPGKGAAFILELPVEFQPPTKAVPDKESADSVENAEAVPI
jgi:PAS domain S-box-containing protein